MSSEPSTIGSLPATSTNVATNEFSQEEPAKSPSKINEGSKLFKSPKIDKGRKRKYANVTIDEKQNEAYALMKDLQNQKKSRDKFHVFGEHVAFKIRGLRTEQAQNTVEHLICNILWEADMGKYDQPFHSNWPTYNAFPAQSLAQPMHSPGNSCISQDSSSHSSFTLVSTTESPMISPQSVDFLPYSAKPVTSPPVLNVSNEGNENSVLTGEDSGIIYQALKNALQ